MNWYKKIAALEPGAWDWYGTEQTHRIVQDKPYVNSPFGGGLIYQKTRPKEELESDYYGVHVTQDPKLAAIYANNFAITEDPPVVIEINNTQKWEIDIDAIKDMLDANTIQSEWIDSNLDYSVRDEMRRTPKDKKIEVINSIMNDISDLDFGYDEDQNEWEDVADIISRNAKRRFPSAFIEYWRHFYGENAPKAFHNYFILPMYFNKGKLDNRWQGWIINQMRFMEAVPESQITAIYTLEPFSLELSKEYNESDEEKTDENNKKMYGYEDLDYGSPHLTEIWRRQQNQLFPQVFDIYYHGTTLSRAKAALPELISVLNKIK